MHFNLAFPSVQIKPLKSFLKIIFHIESISVNVLLLPSIRSCIQTQLNSLLESELSRANQCHAPTSGPQTPVFSFLPDSMLLIGADCIPNGISSILGRISSQKMTKDLSVQPTMKNSLKLMQLNLYQVLESLLSLMAFLCWVNFIFPYYSHNSPVHESSQAYSPKTLKNRSDLTCASKAVS